MALRFGDNPPAAPEAKSKLRFGENPPAPESSFGERVGGLIERAGNSFEDLTRIAGDTVTRGYLDKLSGPEAQAGTQAARERTSDWVEAPIDIGYGIASSPWRIAGAGIGAVAGGLEGMASAYGHQKGWMPEVGNILKEGGKGAALGFGGAQLGKWVDKWRAGSKAKSAQPYKTDKDLEEALATREFMGDTGIGLQDYRDRLARLKAVREAGDTGRSAFGEIAPGSADEAAKFAKIAQGPRSAVTTAADVANAAVKKELSVPLLLAETVTQGGIPWTSIAGLTGKEVLSRAGRSKWATRVPGKEVEDAAALVRDPRGIGLQADPTNAARDFAAKMLISYGRSP